MLVENLEEIAAYIVDDGKGILAADESNPTCSKRFESIGVVSTEEKRRDYREMLFRSDGMPDNIGGVILFDETIRQRAADGTLLREVIAEQGALFGIKVDQGLRPIDGCPGETVTVGLDGLNERLQEYASIGAKFTKWRAVIKIGSTIPSEKCIELNMEALANYAALAQANGMVPIVEPEVLMEGEHTIDSCHEVTERALKALFQCLEQDGVNLKGSLLKPNMITAGSGCSVQASVDDVAERTLTCLKAIVPPAVPGICFLSGGQSDLQATAHLDAMNKIGGSPWKISFSFGRALQSSALSAWGGSPDRVRSAQDAFSHRASMNRLAALGKWNKELEAG